jgi:hypothetical protein
MVIDSENINSDEILAAEELDNLVDSIMDITTESTTPMKKLTATPSASQQSLPSPIQKKPPW